MHMTLEVKQYLVNAKISGSGGMYIYRTPGKLKLSSWSCLGMCDNAYACACIYDCDSSSDYVVIVR